MKTKLPTVKPKVKSGKRGRPRNVETVTKVPEVKSAGLVTRPKPISKRLPKTPPTLGTKKGL